MTTQADSVPSVGKRFPDVSLPLLDGGELTFSSLRGKKVLIYMWGSWWRCRDQLPGWQRFYEQNRDENFELVSVAVETQGADAARPWIERSGGKHLAVVDQHNLLARLLDFKAVPNGVFLDEQGIIRYAKYGGFSVDQPDDVEVIQKLINGEITEQAPTDTEAPYTLSPVEKQLIETRLRLGSELLARGESEGALAEWQKALEMDPENFVIRKQIWAVRYPEKFYPTIDFDWQGEQLRREREEEVTRGVCGPDGCPLPQNRS